MADGICFLKESGTGKDIAVNAQLVRLVKEIDATRVMIIFDNDLQITVDGSVASISDALRKSKGCCGRTGRHFRYNTAPRPHPARRRGLRFRVLDVHVESAGRRISF